MDAERLFVIDKVTKLVIANTWSEDPEGYQIDEGTNEKLTSATAGVDLTSVQLEPPLEDQAWYWNDVSKEFQTDPV